MRAYRRASVYFSCTLRGVGGFLSDRLKTCGYRHCGRTFEDTSLKNSQKCCCPEHTRREKAFRLGKAKDESYFRADKETGWRTCQQCGEKFKRSQSKSVRCPVCLEVNRNKSCSRCGCSFKDLSAKNTRRFCDTCQVTSIERRAKVSDRTDEHRRGYVRRGMGRLDDFKSMVPYSQTWWGRVGEILALHAYPDASDSVREYGNRAPFDMQHRELGRVNVKTAKAKRTKYGKLAWSFQIAGVNLNSDSAFLVGFSETRDRVLHVWSAPSCDLPDRIKVLSPDSCEYTENAWERRDLVPILDRKLQDILASVTPSPPKVSPAPRVEYERIILGRIGEALYKKLHPTSEYVASENPLAPMDFRDVDGTTVNVRLRRRAARDRWTFFRSSSNVDSYFFIGLDPEGRMVETVLRVPEEQVPAHGFSFRSGSNSKWSEFELPLGLPLPVSNWGNLPDFERVHVRLTSLNTETLQSLSKSEIEDLLDEGVRYHRFLGFPFPAVPSDKRLASDIDSIRAYKPNGKDLPVDNAGLGVCSAYMPHRFEARNVNADFSAVNAFLDDSRLRRTLQFCLRGKSPDMTRRGLRSALTALNRTPSNFRPVVAKALVERYSPHGGVVFDPCAGWGGRMMGALVAGRSYVGVEPHARTAEALFRLGGRLCEHMDLDRRQVRIIESPIQTIPDKVVLADMALTSPPYWSQEVYDETQSVLSLDDWIEDFLRPMFRKVLTCLNYGTVFAVNISDIKKSGGIVPLGRLAMEAGESEGFSFEGSWRMARSVFGESVARFEPIYVFRKTDLSRPLGKPA